MDAFAGWQLIMMVSVGMAPMPWSLKAAVIVLHAVLALMAIFARSGRGAVEPIILGGYLTALLVWILSGDLDSPLTFVACWQTNLTTLIATFTLRRHSVLWLPIGAAVLLPVAVLVLIPSWGAALPVSILVTQSAILLASRLGVRALFTFTSRADDAAREIERLDRRIALRDIRRQHLAEDARTLHDTAVNTLGAIASGGAATRNVADVQVRCARDLSILGELAGQADAADLSSPSLSEIFQEPSVQIHRRGVGESQLAELEMQLTPAVIRALVGAAREFCVNASKHALVHEVVVELSVERGQVSVLVEDAGVGFDPVKVQRRGLNSSVVDRIGEVGGTVEITSKLGIGTRASVSVPLGIEQDGEREEGHAGSDVAELAGALRAKSSLSWAVGVSLVGVVIEIANQPGQWTAVYALVVLNIIVVVLSRFFARRERVLQRSLVVLLTTQGVIAFGLSGTAVGFGDGNSLAWQSLAPTAALVMLLAIVRDRRARLVAILTYAGACLLLAALGGAWQADRLLIAGASIAVGVGFWVVWMRFQNAVASVGVSLAAEEELSSREALSSSRRDLLDEKRRYWMRAGLNEAMRLLRKIAAGSADPNAPDVRVACAREEAYLRQLLQLNPSGLHIGEWLVESVNLARRLNIDLSVRAGQIDTEGRDEAGFLGRFMLACVSALPEGGRLTVTVFSTARGLQCTVVAPEQQLATGLSNWFTTTVLPGNVEVRHDVVGDQILVELSIAHTVSGITGERSSELASMKA